jgi:DNA-binding NarL/FixJ family response regulator
MTEIVIADNIFLVREGLKNIIGNKINKVTGEISSSSNFWPKIKDLKPDILILGYGYENMVNISDLEKIKQISEKTKLLIIANGAEKGKIYNAIKAGISGYLTEECAGEEILKAIDSISKGEKFFCNKILDLILEKNFGENTIKDLNENLTEREIEIIKLIAEKYSNQEIADRLFISIHTVYTHRKNIMKKLRLKSPVELILYALDSGIIQT